MQTYIFEDGTTRQFSSLGAALEYAHDNNIRIMQIRNDYNR